MSDIEKNRPIRPTFLHNETTISKSSDFGTPLTVAQRREAASRPNPAARVVAEFRTLRYNHPFLPLFRVDERAVVFK